MTQEEDTFIDINFKILGSPDLVEISLPNSINIESIKDIAADYTDVPRDKIRLILTGRAMRDGTTLKEYNVQNGSVIHIVPERSETRQNDQSTPTQPPPQTEHQNVQQSPMPNSQPPQEQPNIRNENPDLLEIRTVISNIQQILSEFSLAATNVQRGIAQPQVGFSNEALQTLCRQFDENSANLSLLHDKLYEFTAKNGENNEIVFERNASPCPNSFLEGFHSVIDPIFQPTTRYVMLDGSPIENATNNQPSSINEIDTSNTETEPLHIQQNGINEIVENHEDRPENHEEEPIEEDLSQIILDPEEIAIVNQDAESLRDYVPPLFDIDYSPFNEQPM